MPIQCGKSTVVGWIFGTPYWPYQVMLMKILGRAKIFFKEVKESRLHVEATLNNRPQTYLEEEFGPETLTPNYLIHGRRIPMIAWEQPESVSEVDATRR